jgi:hypothetical protein
LEYDYLDLGQRNVTFFGCGAGVACPITIKETASLVTARLNWHFGGP